MSIAKKWTGLKFGKWTVLDRDLNKKRPVRYFCKCECGKTKSNIITNLTTGKSTQCNQCASQSRRKLVIGEKHHKLIVLGFKKDDDVLMVEVLCDCGNKRFLPSGRILSHYKNCGRCTWIKVGTKKGMLEVVEIKQCGIIIALCDCGNKVEVKKEVLKNDMPSCGCYWKNIRLERAKSLIGTKIGYLKVVKFLGMKGLKGKTRAHYVLKCKCGNFIEKDISDIYLINSCGCYQKERVCKGDKNHMSKLSNNELISAKELFKTGLYSQKEIAMMLDISPSHINSILLEKSWKSIK